MWNKENGPSTEPASTPSFLRAALQHMGHLQEGGPWFTAPILGQGYTFSISPMDAAVSLGFGLHTQLIDTLQRCQCWA